MKRAKMALSVMANGPYMVSGGLTVSMMTIGADANGESVVWLEPALPPPGASYALCRCGASQTKPYCDGSHVKVGFEGTETASRAPYLEQAELWDGPVLELMDA